MKEEVRVRFAPSPTGPQHIGGIRTALYNYLFAKKHNGKFILRIEDTDQNRFVPGSEEYLVKALEWLNIKPDESNKEGGDYGPYKQSVRKELYKQYVDNLVQSGNAYYAFDTPEEIDAMREKLKAARIAAPQYNSISRETMKNSLTLPPEDVNKKLKSGTPYVIRIKIPRKKEIRIKDLIRGWISVDSSTLDDKVLMKSDGMPTYHLANVIDDHLMKISHVIRGEEWLPSTPIHVLLYDFFGWKIPQFAHLPLLLKPNGVGKLSKREADKEGFPVFPLDWQNPQNKEKFNGFRESGYLPEAIVNFLAFLGWNPGDNREIFSLKELSEIFSIERVSKSGVKFDIQKAQWFNQQYIKAKSSTDLAKYLNSEIINPSITYNLESIQHICDLIKDRATFIKDFVDLSKYFFDKPQSYDQKIIEKKWNQESKKALEEFCQSIKALTTFNTDSIKNILHQTMENHNLKFGAFLPVLRVSITGLGSGPDLTQIILILGKEEALIRIMNAINSF